jgi:spore cortex formation protein SpoVR/YcgB (stage V sporulation)
MLTVYVLKNGVGRYNIFFYFYTKLAKSSFLCRFRVESVNVFVLPRFDLSTCSSINKQFNKFAHAQTLSRMSSPSGRMNIARVNIEILLDTRESNRRISFVLGYLRMALWKISTAISIKRRILATFNKNKINSDSL